MATTANNYAEQGGLCPPASLSEQIAEHLAREIITGRLGANARIQELRVADDLGVSRGSVREALLILESRHLIDLLPRRGAIVRELDGEGLVSFSELFSGSGGGLLLQARPGAARRSRGAGPGR